MYKIEVLNTAFKGKRFKFKDLLTIGSGASATIRAQHAEMAENHARIVMSEGKPLIEAMADKAKIFINNKDVLRGLLKHNDEFQVGPLHFRLLDETMMSSGSLRLDQLVEQMASADTDDVYDFAKEDLFYLTTRDPSLRERISFRIPSKDRFIDQAQIFLARLVKASSIEELKLEAFMTCLKELILNAHRHGHKYDESKTIIVRYRDFGSKIQVSIEDQGVGFDHRSIVGDTKSKDAATAARERYLAGGFGGLGFQMITKMSDELAYNDKGNKVTFVIKKQQ